MGHNSRKMQRLSCRAHYVAGIELAGESNEPPNAGLEGHRALPVDGEPPHWEIFSPPDRLHKHKWDEQAGLPPPAPESPDLPSPDPSQQTEPKPTNPTIEDPPQED